MYPDPETAEDVPNTPTNPGRTKRKFKFSPKKLQEAAGEAESQEIAPEPAQRTTPRRSSVRSLAEEANRQATSGETAIARLQKELRDLGAAGLTPAECRKAENILFDAFSQFRRRGIE